MLSVVLCPGVLQTHVNLSDNQSTHSADLGSVEDILNERSDTILYPASVLDPLNHLKTKVQNSHFSHGWIGQRLSCVIFFDRSCPCVSSCLWECVFSRVSCRTSTCRCRPPSTQPAGAGEIRPRCGACWPTCWGLNMEPSVWYSPRVHLFTWSL